MEQRTLCEQLEELYQCSQSYQERIDLLDRMIKYCRINRFRSVTLDICRNRCGGSFNGNYANSNLNNNLNGNFLNGSNTLLSDLNPCQSTSSVR